MCRAIEKATEPSHVSKSCRSSGASPPKLEARPVASSEHAVWDRVNGVPGGRSELLLEDLATAASKMRSGVDSTFEVGWSLSRLSYLRETRARILLQLRFRTGHEVAINLFFSFAMRPPPATRRLPRTSFNVQWSIDCGRDRQRTRRRCRASTTQRARSNEQRGS
jgi:hypothetical protein